MREERAFLSDSVNSRSIMSSRKMASLGLSSRKNPSVCVSLVFLTADGGLTFNE